jgi:hypothetical protein
MNIVFADDNVKVKFNKFLYADYLRNINRYKRKLLHTEKLHNISGIRNDIFPPDLTKFNT